MNNSIDRLLLIDDDEDLRNLLLKRFQQTEVIVDQASDVPSAKKKLYENTYDIIILDLVMYPESGYTLFAMLKSDPKLKWVPLIVLSGSSEIEDKVKCFELGADDYVTKPFQFKELNARVRRILARSRQFDQLAFRDPLTGVYNRRYFDNQLAAELQRVARIPTAMSLAILDIDRFKSINDTYGHPVGDQVLQALSRLLQTNLREIDLLARYGGEEFAVLLFDTAEREAKSVMEGLQHKLKMLSLAQAGEQDISVTFSAGIAEWTPELSGAQWMERADLLLYQAKHAGRDTVLAWHDASQ
jgi:two-component system cell cycle response regulator